MALDYLPSPGWAVIYGETPSATRWSELGDNDDALATGAGIDDAAILTRHLAAAGVTLPKLDTSTFDVIRKTSVGGETTINTGTVKSANLAFKGSVVYLVICSILWHTTAGGNKLVSLRVNGTTIDQHRSEVNLQTPLMLMGVYRPASNATLALDLSISNVAGSATATFGTTTYTIIPLITTAAIA